jgi:hypothetical protein
MDRPELRAHLEAIVGRAESDAVRLQAINALAELEAREHDESRRPPPIDYANSLANDPARLGKLLDLAGEHLFPVLPAWRAAVERRAEELIEERARQAREQFVILDAEDADEQPEAEQRHENQPDPPEAISGSETAGENPPAIAPEVLARQWPSRRGTASASRLDGHPRNRTDGF